MYLFVTYCRTATRRRNRHVDGRKDRDGDTDGLGDMEGSKDMDGDTDGSGDVEESKDRDGDTDGSLVIILSKTSFKLPPDGCVLKKTPSSSSRQPFGSTVSE